MTYRFCNIYIFDKQLNHTGAVTTNHIYKKEIKSRVYTCTIHRKIQ